LESPVQDLVELGLDHEGLGHTVNLLVDRIVLSQEDPHLQPALTEVPKLRREVPRHLPDRRPRHPEIRLRRELNLPVRVADPTVVGHEEWRVEEELRVFLDLEDRSRGVAKRRVDLVEDALRADRRMTGHCSSRSSATLRKTRRPTAPAGARGVKFSERSW